MRRALAALALVAAAGGVTSATAEDRSETPATRRPNLLLLAIDTLRADHLGCYGYERPTSPHLDALAADGIRFARAVSNSPWTLPSFATLFTGRVPTRHGAGMAGPLRNLGEDRPHILAPSVPTLAEVLGAAGYRTAGISSNPYLLLGCQRGFAEFTCRFLAADRIGALARSWLARRGSQEPFFLFVHFNDPHEPTDPPAPLLESLGLDDVVADPRRHLLERWGGSAGDPTYLGRQPSAAVAGELLHTKVALYDAAILQVDLEIGLLLEQLERQGLRDDTLVVVVSDHGEEFLEHVGVERAWDADPRDVWGIGHGHTLFDELLHVALLAAGPSLPEGRTVLEQFPLTEVMPTVLGWLGVTAPAGMDGRDRRSWIEDPRRRPIAAPLEGTAYGPDLIGWSDGRRKLVAERSGRLLWAFDLLADPAEDVNLLATAAGAKASAAGGEIGGALPATADGAAWRALDDSLRAWNARALAQAPAEATPAALSEAVRRGLRSLGYVQ